MNGFPKEMLDIAKNEKNISANDLLADIKAYISEYYVCGTEGDNIVQLNFFNGQKFRIKIEEVI